MDQVCAGTGFIDCQILIRRWEVRLLLSDSQMELMEAGMGFSGFSDFSS